MKMERSVEVRMLVVGCVEGAVEKAVGGKKARWRLFRILIQGRDITSQKLPNALFLEKEMMEGRYQRM
jgi:hypothetical protein